MHKFPNNKVYIGITSKNSVKKRWLHGRGYKTQQLWNTFEEIHRALNINTGTVCECCLHKRENTKGYKWKYILVLDTGGSVIL